MLEFKTNIEIELMDEEDKPVGNEEYIIYLTNGEVRKGKLDGSGYKKEEKIPPCHHSIRFPCLNNIRRENMPWPGRP